MEICSIPSMFFITGVKAYNHLSISEIGIQSWQYAKVRTTGSSVYDTFSSNIKHNCAFTEKTDKYDFSLSLYGHQAPCCWNLVKNSNFRGFEGAV